MTKLKVLADPVASDSLLPSLQMATFSLYPHMAKRKRHEEALMSLLMRALIPFMKAPHS